ncbi:MAG: U32 family peptidase [Clostridia bacterium]|nr:U32 family peptidase [Clostridia bacterium]
MKNNNQIELLAPAGSMDSFKAACQNGADAVYMGVSKFNARTMAANFTMEEYIECIEYAHLRHVKVHLTLNTLMYDDEIKEALEIVLALYARGLDAVIIQDIGLAMLIHQLLPNLPLHASTQMSVYSLEQVNYLASIGFQRVVLARELTLSEIEYICQNTDIEIEVFIHGALCVSVSGQCLLSSTIGDRSANRGKCAQPCRMKYSLYNKSGKELIKQSYLLSKKDIFGIEYVQKLKEIGVTSLKIEGRNKNPEYVAGVTKNYRKAIDKVEVEKNTKQELLQLFNRSGESTGYFEGVKYKNSISILSPKNTGIYLGKVIDKKGVYVKLKLEADMHIHDGFEIYDGNTVVSNIVTCIKNDQFININCNQNIGETIWIGDIKKNVAIGSTIYKTSSDTLNKKYRMSYINNVENVKSKVALDIVIQKDKNIIAISYVDGKKITTELDYLPPTAHNKSVSKMDIEAAFSKTQEVPFEFIYHTIEIDDGLFVPVSILNELRRKVLADIADSYKVHIDVTEQESKLDSLLRNSISDCVKIKNTNTVEASYIYEYNSKVNYLTTPDIKRLYIDVADYIKYREEIKQKYSNIELYLFFSNVILNKKKKYIVEHINDIFKDSIAGVLLGSFDFLEIILKLKQQYNFVLVADDSLNVSNVYSATFLIKQGFDVITPAYDISTCDIEIMSKYVNIEIIKDYITVMTSRYCLLGSMLEDRKEGINCKMPCLKDNYYLKDDYGYQYHIITDKMDCVMRLVKQVRNIDLKESAIQNITAIRKGIL